MTELQNSDRNSASDEQLRVAGWCVAFICAVALPTGAAKLLPGIVSNPGKLNEDTAQAMFQVFVLTGPLVLAATLATLCAMRKWFGEKAIWALASVSFGAWLLGRLGLGIAPAIPQHIQNLGHPALTVVGFVLKGYAEVTGWLLTIVSVFLGCFFGWVSNTRMPREWRQLLDEKFSSRPE
jgi:hypothetical protein